MNEGFNQLDYQAISLAVCSREKYYACLLKGSGGRPDKIVTGEIDGEQIYNCSTFDCSKAALGNIASCKFHISS